MSDFKEKYIGEAKIKDEPKKKLSFKIADGAVTTDKIQNGAVTKDKMAEKSVGLPELASDVHQALASVHEGGIAVTNDFGDSEYIGISQKTITEMKSALDTDIADINNVIGEDETEGTLKGRIGALEESDATINQRITEERNRALIAESALSNGIEGLTQSNIVILSSQPTGTGQPNTIYRVAGESSYTDYAWNGNAYIPLATYNNAIDDVPIKESENLVKSGGIYNAIIPETRDAISGNYRVTSSKGYYYDPSTGTIAYDSSTNAHRFIYFWELPFNKGDVIHFEGVIASGSESAAYNNFLTSEISPVEYARDNSDSIVGLPVTFYTSTVGKESARNFDFLVPFDNCYVLAAYNETYYVGGSFTFKYHYNTKNSNDIAVLNSIVEDSKAYISALPEIVSGSGYEMNYITLKVKSASNNNYRVDYFSEPFNKGDIIHFKGTSSSIKTNNFFICDDNPATYNVDETTGVNSILGMPVEFLYGYSGTVHEYDVTIPRDNVYVCYYFHTENWTSRELTYYKQGDTKKWRKNIEDSIDSKINVVNSDVTPSFTWIKAASQSRYLSNIPNIVVDDETGDITIGLVNHSGYRFAIKTTNLPAGKYKIEFDSTQHLAGGAFYPAQVSDSAISNTEFLPEGLIVNTAHTWEDGHYSLVIETSQTRTFYITYSVQSQPTHTTGTQIIISNFTVTEIVNDISSWKERLDTLDLKSEIVDGMQWYTRTIMGGYMDIGTAIDARETIDDGEGGEIENPEFGNEFIVDRVGVAASSFVPLMDCDKFTIDYYEGVAYDDLADKSGLVVYDENKEPIASLYVETLLSSTTRKSFEFIREDNWKYIRYRTSGGTSYFLSSNVKLYYSYETLRSGLLDDTLIVGTSEVVPTYNHGARWSDFNHTSSSGNWRHCNVIVEGYEFITVSGRIINNDDGLKNYGGYFLDKDGLPLEDAIAYKIPYVSASAYTYSTMTFAIPANAYRFIWTTHKDNLTRPIIKYRSQATWKTNIEEKIDSFDANINDSIVYDKVKKRSTIEKISEAMWTRNTDYALSPDGFIPSDTVGVGMLGLLHYSDWHESMKAGASLMSWGEAIKDYYASIGGTDIKGWIRDIINTGDVVENYRSKGKPNAYFTVEGLADNSLFVLGNHDQCYSSNGDRRYGLVWADAGELGDGVLPAYDISTHEITDAVSATHKFSFNQYFNNYIENWNVTMPEGYDNPNSPYYQACYWHKDYILGYENIGTDASPVYDKPVGIRIIGLDCIYRFDGILKSTKEDGTITGFEFDNNDMIDIADGGEGLAKLTTEQETWLYNTLQETLDPESDAYGFEVILLCHYPLEDLPAGNVLNESGCNTTYGKVLNYRTKDRVNFEFHSADTTATLDNTFDLRNRVKTSGTRGFSKGSVNNFGDILQLFQDNGGKIIAWICGHTHVDHFYYPAKYPNILTVVIDRAGETRPNNISRRNSNSDNTLCANFYAIDVLKGLFKIVRLGLNTNSMLMPLNTLCYDYKNKKVISEG